MEAIVLLLLSYSAPFAHADADSRLVQLVQTEEERWIVRKRLAGLGQVMVVHTEETENEISIVSARIEPRS